MAEHLIKNIVKPLLARITNLPLFLLCHLELPILCFHNQQNILDKNQLQDSKDLLPPSLRLLMESLVSSEVKQSSIGQCILKAIRPNSFTPALLFGLGVEVDHMFGSKWLVNELAKLGFSISYDEVTKFKQSVVLDESNDPQVCINGEFTQWIADNVDHNIITIDGKGTFHGMGVIAATISRNGVIDHSIKRIAKVMKSKQVINNKGIEIHWYCQPDVRPLAKTVLKPIKELRQPLTFQESTNVDLLWHCAGFFNKDERRGPRPNWSGFMHLITSGNTHPPKSIISMLPIIDLNQSDESCIYSTLLHIKNQARQFNIQTACVTLDQEIVAAHSQYDWFLNAGIRIRTNVGNCLW